MHKSIRTGATVIGYMLAGAVLGYVGRFPIAAATQTIEQAPKYAYRYHYIAEYPDPEKVLDQYGAAGWELVSVGPPQQIPESPGSVPVLKHLMVFKKRL